MLHDARPPGRALARRLRPWVLLSVAAATSCIVLLLLGAGLTFFGDEWAMVLHRRGLTPDTFLLPPHEHTAIVPIAIYKALLAVFGMESALPFRVVNTLVLCAAAVLLFVYLRRCVGDWLALVACVVVLFLGAAWEDLLWPLSGIEWAGSTAAGIGMLLALQRQDRRGDVLACALLVLAIATWSLGVAFAAGAATDVILRREHWRSRAYIVAVPAALYALWYAGWGYNAERSVSIDNLVATPRYVLEALGSSIAAVLGFFGFNASVRESLWGRSLLVGGGMLMLGSLALMGRRLHRAGSPLLAGIRQRSHWLWVVAAVAFAFWIMAGLNHIPTREPTTSRYQYPGAVLLLIAVGEALRGVRVKRRAKIVVSVLAALALVGNLIALRDGRHHLQHESDLARAELGALEIARGTANPAFRLEPGISASEHLARVDAGSYYAAVDAFGSPANNAAELARAPEAARAAADVVLASSLPLTLERSPATKRAGRTLIRPGKGFDAHGTCVPVEPMGKGPAALTVPPGRAFLYASAGEPAQVRLGRFATDSFPVRAGAIRGNSFAVLEIPKDRATKRWRLKIDASQAVTACIR